MSDIMNLIKNLDKEPWLTMNVLADALEENEHLLSHIAPGLRILAEGQKFPDNDGDGYSWGCADPQDEKQSNLPLVVWKHAAVSYINLQRSTRLHAIRHGRIFTTSGEAITAAATAWAAILADLKTVNKPLETDYTETTWHDTRNIRVDPQDEI